MKVSINKLKKICTLLLKQIDEIQGQEFNIDNDFYLMVSRLERQNIEKENPKLSIGSINEDLEALEKVLTKKKDLDILDLEKIGQVFISLGQMLEKKSIFFL